MSHRLASWDEKSITSTEFLDPVTKRNLQLALEDVPHVTHDTPVLLKCRVDLNQTELFVIPRRGFESNARRAGLPVEMFKINPHSIHS
jgi:hypothetical protein